jgi:hypothetical protein
MKKIKYIFLSVAICIASLALILQSCNNENGVSSSDSASKIVISAQYDYLNVPKEFQQIGQYHNEGMDSMFVGIKSALVTYRRTLKLDKVNKIASANQSASFVIGINSIVQETLLKYCNSNKLLRSNYAVCKKYIDQSFLKSGEIKVNSALKINGDSTALQKYIDRIHVCIKSEVNNPISNLKHKLTIINQDATKELNENDALVVFAATSTAYASYQYWEKNFIKWLVMLREEDFAKLYNNTSNKTLRQKILAVENQDGSFEGGQIILGGVTICGSQLNAILSQLWSQSAAPLIGADIDGAVVGFTTTVGTAVAASIFSGGTATPIAAGVAGSSAITGGLENSTNEAIIQATGFDFNNYFYHLLHP